MIARRDIKLNPPTEMSAFLLFYGLIVTITYKSSSLLKYFMLTQIDKRIEEKKEEIIEFTKSLIRIPTENPPGKNYTKIVDFIKKEFEKDPFYSNIYYKNNKPNLVIRWVVNSKKTLHINGHYDTVPATSNWKSDPFKPVIADGKLFGRGALDMKSGLSVMVYTLKIMSEMNCKPACNIELSFTCDEETGGIDGLGYLIKEKKINPDYALTVDGAVSEIINGSKGVLALEITVLGKSSHAGWPRDGINAFIGACKLSGKLDELNRGFSKIKTKVGTRKESEKSPTIVLGGKAAGGTKFNTVPDAFSFTVDRRIIPEEKMIDVRKQITEVIDEFRKNYPEYKVKIKTLLEAEPSYVDKNVKISRILYEAINKVKTTPPSYSIISGFLDMRYFINNAGIGCINYGAEGGNVHGDDEYVHINSIFENIRILADVMFNPELDK